MDQYDYSKLKSCGENVFISGNVEIRRPHLITIGSHIAIDTGFYCTVGAQLGDYIHIGPYTTIIGGAEGFLTMGHFTTIAAGSRLICVSDEHLGAGLVGPTIPDGFKDNLIKKPIFIERFASIGTNCIVYPGVTLAEGSVLGAGSLLNRNTEPWTIYVGMPARAVKHRSQLMKEKAKALGYNL